MDPISQGLFGAVAAGAISKKENIKSGLLLGALSGMAADLDVLIRSKSDHLLWLEFHRHFTHSLFFIPFGGLICALVLHQIVKSKLSFKETFIFCLIGYATHGLLDTCTSYGTSFLWPLSDARLTWSIMSIVDPIFTIALLVFVVRAYKQQLPKLARLGLVFILIFFLFGKIQHHRIACTQETLAKSRGHIIARGLVKPSAGNLVLWRSVYEAEGKYYVDAIRTGLFSKPLVYAGGKIEKFELTKAYPTLSPDSTTAKDIERFRHFSQGYISQDPKDDTLVIDVRYGILPHLLDPLWGVRVDVDKPNSHTPFRTFRSGFSNRFGIFREMVFRDK